MEKKNLKSPFEPSKSHNLAVNTTDCRLLTATSTTRLTFNACLKQAFSPCLKRSLFEEFQADGTDLVWNLTMKHDPNGPAVEKFKQGGVKFLINLNCTSDTISSIFLRSVTFDVHQSAPISHLVETCKSHQTEVNESSFQVHKTLNFITLVKHKQTGSFLSDINCHFRFVDYVDNVITIRVSVEYLGQYETHRALLLPISRLSLESLLFSEKLSDVSLCVDQKEVPAHRAILAARSPVFLSMFEPQWKENSSAKVIIADFSLNTIKHLLRFIYTGDIKIKEMLELEEHLDLSGFFHTGELGCSLSNDVEETLQLEEQQLLDLLLAADYYIVDDLVLECKARLAARISTNEAGVASLCNLLYYCSLRDSKVTFDMCLSYLRGHRKEVFSSKMWKRFCADCKEVAGNVLIQLSGEN